MERNQGNPCVVNMIYRGFALSAEVLSKRDISLIYHTFVGSTWIFLFPSVTILLSNLPCCTKDDNYNNWNNSGIANTIHRKNYLQHLLITLNVVNVCFHKYLNHLRRSIWLSATIWVTLYKLWLFRIDMINETTLF